MSKAAKFDEFLSSNNINCFSKEEIDNEMHSIVYRAHKVFKYYEGDNGDICLDSCITTTDEGFEAPVIHTVIDVILKHLVEEYPVLMRKVWGN